ncbi:MAG: adenosylcobinamide-GDP ribazoletransferase [Pseudomonadota bacterium]
MIIREIGHFFVGTMFLTRLPVPPGLAFVEGRLARAARYFPLVGALVGLISGTIFLTAAFVLPAIVAAGLAIAAGIIVTGALHEDGLADCCDGLGGGSTAERALEIMRDSRIGTYGAAALIISIGLRWSALSTLLPVQGLIALVIAHCVSRALIAPVLISARYARTRGLASSVAGGVSPLEATVALAIGVAVAMSIGPVPGLIALAAGAVAAGAMLGLLIRRLGGYTGDGLGAIQQCAEIAILCALAGVMA